MKCKIAIIFILLFSINLHAQGVTLESEKLTTEQKRVQKIEEELRKLQDDYSKSKTQHEKNTLGLFPNSFSLGADKKVLLQKKKDIQAVLYSIQERGLKEKAREIDKLSSSIGGKFSYSSALQRRIDVLYENQKKINNTLNGIRKEEGKKNTEEIIQNIELSKLDKEISDLDAMLANSKTTTPKKTKSLDDFLTEKRKTNNISKSSNSLDDMLSSSNNKSTSSSNSLDDMLSSGNTTSNSNNLDDLISTTSNETDFKIDTKNNLTGVISGRGKILIPYKDWEIDEYKMGIAKVRKKIESKSCNGTYTAYKEGFVDVNGKFIDGFEIDFTNYESIDYEPLTIKATFNYSTESERLAAEARGREYRRKKAIKKKQREIANKKCKIEINNWKNSIKSRYR